MLFKTKTNWSFISLALILVSIGLSQCRKVVIDDNPDMQNMVVPADFDYEITTDINVTVILPTTVDYSERNKKIEIYNNDPAANGQVINTGAADHSGIYRTTIQIPISLSTLYIKSFAGLRVLNLGSDMKGLMDDYEANYGDEYSSEPPDTTPDGLPGQAAGFHWKQSVLKSGSNFIGNPGFETNDFGKQVYWSSTMTADKKWYFAHNTQNYTSQQSDGDNKLIDISTSFYAYGGVTQLVDAVAGEEISFTADARDIGSRKGYIYLYLIPRNSSQQALNYPNVRYVFSGNDWHTKTVAATMPSNTASCQILIWTNMYSGSNFQFDNVVVNIKGRIIDSDQDGVEDDEDAYPNDKDKAFNDYYPGEGAFGTLAYEDMWPTEGDYDFNDLVVGYQYNYIKNASNEITSLGIQYQLRAIGASISNGFGVSLNISPDKVASVSNSYSFNSENITLSSNGTESGQSNATIIVFENAFNLLEHPGGEMGINTDPNGTYVDPAMISLAIDFTEGLSIAEIGNAPGNPFLFRSNDRSHEIHLPGTEPTDLADQSKFGTGDDATNLENKYYYKTGNGLPWGMNLPVSFVYPNEKVKIVNGHLKFNQWATSGGYSFMDWYEDIEGYRDNDYLYTN